LSDGEDAAAEGEPAERPGTGGSREDNPGRDASANGNAADPPAGAESGRWDGNAAQVPPVSDAGSAAPSDEEPTDAHEMWLSDDQQKSNLRAKIPEGSYFRDVLIRT
jgi:hypothetical protein